MLERCYINIAFNNCEHFINFKNLGSDTKKENTEELPKIFRKLDECALHIFINIVVSGYLLFKDFCENVTEDSVPQIKFYEEVSQVKESYTIVYIRIKGAELSYMGQQHLERCTIKVCGIQNQRFSIRTMTIEHSA